MSVLLQLLAAGALVVFMIAVRLLSDQRVLQSRRDCAIRTECSGGCGRPANPQDGHPGTLD